MPLVEGPLLRKPYQRAEFAAIILSVMGAGKVKPGELEHSLGGRAMPDGAAGSKSMGTEKQ
jgi:hypothetical protein